MNIQTKIDIIRKKMEENDVDAYIVLSDDPHQTEFPHIHWTCRKWISGFSGSVGTVVITKDKAIVFTAPMYEVQSKNELAGTGYEIKLMTNRFATEYVEWLAGNIEPGSTVAMDGRTVSVNLYDKLVKLLTKKQIKINLYLDLVGQIWEDRPELPMDEIFIYNVKYSGKSSKDKLEEVRNIMSTKKVDTYLIGSLDDISWLYNFRSRAIVFNPMDYSYALVGKEYAYLYIDNKKVTEDVRKALSSEGITIKGYEEIVEDIKILENNSVYIDPKRTNALLYSSISSNCEIIEGTNITTDLKVIKNEIELKNLREVQKREGANISKFIYWMKQNVGKEHITELSAQVKLLQFLKLHEDMVGSYPPLIQYGANAAMPHYYPTEETNAVVKPKGAFLFDCGGHYYGCTTDTTRTIALGKLSDEFKTHFTAVLKSLIKISTLRFPEGSAGVLLSGIIRDELWRYGIHGAGGTGHGVGNCLNVHEMPPMIRYTPIIESRHLAGMNTTLEPGSYQDGKFGIRIENMAIIYKDIKTQNAQFLKFETVTRIPIELDAINVSMLTDSELEWLNNYHKAVYNDIVEFMDVEERNWLAEATCEIKR